VKPGGCATIWYIRLGFSVLHEHVAKTRERARLEGGEGLTESRNEEETTLGSLLPHLYKKVFHATVQAMPAFTPVVTTCGFFI
jgi:hypothetical protein